MIRWRVFSAIMVVLASIISQGMCDSQGVFELRLKNFENKFGKDSEGHCCDGFRTSSGQCSGVCSTKFRVCLKHYQKKVDPSHECTFGENITPVMGNNVANFDTIQFPLDFKWPGTFSLIIEAWHENNKTTDGKSLISRLATQNQLDAGRDWTHGVHQESHTKLEYEYRMLCSAQYYGKDCDTLCRPRDDQFGHYTCGSQGQKVCMEGWQKDPSKPEGDYCTKAQCLKGCHPDHGECERPGQCKCKTGWTGALCEQCLRYPGCVHGSCERPYQCRCNEGWGGLFCNQDLNYCTNHRPCRNGATCRNTGQGSYTCSCPPGYSGANCESRISNECSHQPCYNGGTCQGSGTNYTCVCPLGFHGQNCEKRAQTCADSPCKNGATCSDEKGQYTCKCTNEYQGVNCDVKMDQCKANPCQNGGTCQTLDNGGYQCQCPKGIAGTNCEKNVDDCVSNPCKNGGTCIDFVNDFKCNCVAGFIGRNCEHNVDDCSTNPCANGGTCHDSINDFACTCTPGYSGKFCSEKVNQCDHSPCGAHGVCTNKFNNFECKCFDGYSGDRCNILPNGEVLKMSMEGEEEEQSQWPLIITFSTLIPLVVIVAVLYLLCNKRRQRALQRRADEEAKRENELNAVSCGNKAKILDDHMIVNHLDIPKLKCVNLADEEHHFKAKEYGSKQLNTSYDKPRLSNLPSAARRFEGSSTASSSSGASSVCSSDINRGGACSSSTLSNSCSSKEASLPTAKSIQASAAAAKGASSLLYYSAEDRQQAKTSFSQDLFATEV